MAEPGLFDRGKNWLRRGGGPVAEAVYQPAVIFAAGVWRRMLTSTSFIGVTGSAGKTTTKELLHAALARSHRTIKSFDSDNVLYPTARTLMRVTPATRFCVQEVGAWTPGNFDPILKLLRPSIGIVTNIGTDHFSAFRTRERVAEEKGKLIECLPADGLAVLNADDAMVASMASRTPARIVTFGVDSDADYRGEIVSHTWPGRLVMRIHHRKESTLMQTQLLGAYQAVNLLAAVACAHALGMSMNEISLGVGSCQPLLGRMSVHATTKGVTFIRDDFKAPGWVMQSALHYMVGAQATRKLIVIGTISDSGGDSKVVRAYKQALSQAADAADRVLLIGPRAASMVGRMKESESSCRMHAFESVREASIWMRDYLRPGDLVLLKGSNKADHLARLALSVDGQVECWRARCGWVKFCDQCALIDKPAL